MDRHRADCELAETSFGDYSYAADSVSIIYTDAGKFCSVLALRSTSLKSCSRLRGGTRRATLTARFDDLRDVQVFVARYG